MEHKSHTSAVLFDARRRHRLAGYQPSKALVTTPKHDPISAAVRAPVVPSLPFEVACAALLRFSLGVHAAGDCSLL